MPAVARFFFVSIRAKSEDLRLAEEAGVVFPEA
jgi:hypothetical protein